MSLSNVMKWWCTPSADDTAGMAVIPVSVPLSEPAPRAAQKESAIREPMDDATWCAEQERLLAAARAEADELVSRARTEAEAVLSEAMRERDRLWEEARAAGYAEGLRQGRAEAAEELERERKALQETWAAALRAMGAERERWWQSLPGSLTAVCMEAIRSLIRRELAAAPSDVERMVGELLGLVSESTRAEVRVHPSEYDAAIAAHPRWCLGRLGEWDVVVIPDPQVSPGGCEIRSDRGRVDARLETKLELLQPALERVLAQGVRTCDGPDGG
ncbi:MAG: hypothetical protein K6T81_17765 [Alicyclobacillus macrosporangiidus]|uniref:FliH/SctL family protein n=1 Tax=Alicyclobacillus macrosporangiidus TaxID=392015 RepID=UPI0026EDAF22|nr:FliH/SctL family protein [Alicyclobacillus macrosporangiidus]MCL6600559.1 hypothetical protein [Alicyclobacillus macrosporangiidus]